MFFKDVIGQQTAAQQLRQAIDDGRMPHALMISGRESSGALTLALAAAQYLLCETHSADGEPCGQCNHCKMVQRLQHPDLHFVFPVVNKSGQSGENSAVSDDYIEEWRDKLLRNPEMPFNEWVKYISDEGKAAQIYKNEATSIVRKLSAKPFASDSRVMIIWLPEKINETASNKLLKIIQENFAGMIIKIIITFRNFHRIGFFFGNKKNPVNIIFGSSYADCNFTEGIGFSRAYVISRRV